MTSDPRGYSAPCLFCGQSGLSWFVHSSAPIDDDLGELLGVAPGKVDVIPLGPGLATGVAPAPEAQLRATLGLGSGPLVLSVSARRPHKNLVRLIEAIGRIPDAELVLPGYPTAFDDDLLDAARRVGATDRVHLCGWIDDAQLEGLYAASTCLAFPSLAEGFGLPVLEAMARGLPVACTRDSAPGEVAGDAGLALDPTSEDSIAEATLALDHLAPAGRALYFTDFADRRLARLINRERLAALAI